MAQPIWVTPSGPLEGPIPEGVFFQKPLEAYDPDGDTVFFELIAGSLPTGMQIQQTGLMTGIPKATVNVQGVPEQVSRDVTSKFAIRAYTRRTVNGVTVINRLADRTFTLTITGQDVPQWVTPPGQIAQFFDGTLVTDLQVEYTDVDPDDTVVVTLVSGSLPPGLSISPRGVISGLIPPNSPVDPTNENYEFVLEVSDGKVGGSNLRTFSIYVWSRALMEADTTEVTADNDFITADVAPGWIPVLLNPQGSIGTTRNDNWFAYKFNAVDFNDDRVQYIISSSSPVPLSSVGLTLDIDTGWLYGYIPNLGLGSLVYTFDIRVYKENDPEYISNPYTYTLEITGPVDTDVIWETASDLGSIDNGSTSTFYVKAVNLQGIELQYELLSGSDSSLPQGLQLLPSGDIAGRVSFNTFVLDGGSTTFDVTKENGQDPTTFDLNFTFTVRAFSVNGLVSATKTFTIRVIRAYNEPYENLYIKAMPPFDDRNLIDSLLQNSDIFPNDLIYRPTDPNFGIAKNVVYMHAFGLTASTYEEYVSSLYENHYWKDLVLGSIEVAQATDGLGNVIYEVVYSRVIDNLLNNQGESVSKAVTLPFPINENDSTEIDTVYPNSLINMRDQVIDTVGKVGEVLPTWMLSKQANGSVLGFVPAWVIAYAKPGKGNQLAYNIRTQFGNQLNLIDFEVDRYELDRLLTKNWDPIYDSTGGSWIPNPPTITTFDYDSTDAIDEWLNNDDDIVNWVNNDIETVTWISDYNGEPTVFDGNSLQFIDPVDMYSNTDEYDKYLVFPKRTILG